MTKSKGVKRPDWDWTQHQIEYLQTSYLTCSCNQIAIHIGCTKLQVQFKANKLGLSRPCGALLIGRRLDKLHVVNISKGMLLAAKEGRLKPLSEEVKKLGMIAVRNPVAVAKAVQTRSKMLKGRPQRLTACTAAAPHNKAAKIWVVNSPEKITYEFQNLSHFVREHPYLFLPADVIWKDKGNNPWCRALRGLNSLFKTKNQALQWKGWTAVKKLPGVFEMQS